MAPTKFRQDRFLECEVTGVLVKSSVKAEKLQEAEYDSKKTEALSRNRDVAKSNDQVEAQITTLVELGIQFGRDRRTAEGRKLTSTLNGKLARLLRHLSNISAVDQLVPELSSCKKELEAVKAQHESCKKELKEANDKLEETKTASAKVSANLTRCSIDLCRAERANEEMNTDFDNVSANCQRLKMEVKTCTSELEKMKKARQVAEDGQRQARSECKRAQTELSETHNSLKQTTSDLRQKKTELEQAETDMDEMELVSAQLKSASSRAEEEQKQLKSALQQAQAELQVAVDQRHEADRKTQAADGARHQSEASVAEERVKAQKERQAAKEDREQSEAQLAKVSQEVKEKSQLLRQVNDRLNLLRNDRQSMTEHRRLLEGERQKLAEERKTLEEERQKLEEERQVLGKERKDASEDRRTAGKEHSRAYAERHRAEDIRKRAAEECQQAEEECRQANEQRRQMAHKLQIAEAKAAEYHQAISHAAQEFCGTLPACSDDTAANLPWLIECVRQEMTFRSDVVKYLFATRRLVAFSDDACCENHDFALNIPHIPLTALDVSSPACLRPLETKARALSAAETFNNVLSATIEAESASRRSIAAVRGWLQRSHSRFACGTVVCLQSLCSTIDDHVASMHCLNNELRLKLTTHERTIRVLGLTLMQQQQDAKRRLATARDRLDTSQAGEAATYGRLIRMNDRLLASEDEERRLTHVLLIENKSKERYRFRLLQEKRFSLMWQLKCNDRSELRESGNTSPKRKATSRAPDEIERQRRRPNE